MEGSIRTIHERQRRIPLQWGSRFKLEASLWTSFLVFGWETPIRSLLVIEAPPVAGWVTLGLAFAAMVTAMQVKRKLRKKLAADRVPRIIAAPNPLSLIELIRAHGVREFGSMYLYMPMPRRARHDAAWAWIETLRKEGLIKGDPWRIKVSHVKEAIRTSHAELFTEDTEHVDVYRLDWQTLRDIIGDELP